MSGEITDRDLELADRANLHGASHFASGTTLRDAAAQQLRAYAAAERAAAASPIPWQPFVGGVILKESSPYWGPFHCCGVYVATGAEHAHRVLIARAHLEALRENDYRDRQRLTFELTERARTELASEVA